MADSTRGQVTAPTLPFLNLTTDDKRKRLHHEALAELLKILKLAGMKDYNISHIDDPERNPDIPIKIGSHMYDLSFTKDEHTIILLELKTLKVKTITRHK